MFGFFKTVKEAKAARNALTAAFEARGYMPFTTLDNTIHGVHCALQRAQ
jgi:hypothetical protein